MLKTLQDEILLQWVEQVRNIVGDLVEDFDSNQLLCLLALVESHLAEGAFPKFFMLVNVEISNALFPAQVIPLASS
jgi:hypothetical protein